MLVRIRASTGTGSPLGGLGVPGVAPLCYRETLGIYRHGAMARDAGGLEYLLSVLVPTGRWLVVCPD